METVLHGGLRLHASLERQRRENMAAWAEGPGKPRKPKPHGLKVRDIDGPCDVPLLQTGGYIERHIPSPSGWADMLPRRWRSGTRSALLSHHRDEWQMLQRPKGQAYQSSGLELAGDWGMRLHRHRGEARLRRPSRHFATMGEPATPRNNRGYACRHTGERATSSAKTRAPGR